MSVAGLGLLLEALALAPRDLLGGEHQLLLPAHGRRGLPSLRLRLLSLGTLLAAFGPRGAGVSAAIPPRSHFVI